MTDESSAALAAARTVARYAPDLPGTYTNLGILEYLNGNRDAALAELRTARAADARFDEQLRAALEARSELKALKEDQEFLTELLQPGTFRREEPVSPAGDVFPSGNAHGRLDG